MFSIWKLSVHSTKRRPQKKRLHLTTTRGSRQSRNAGFSVNQTDCQRCSYVMRDSFTVSLQEQRQLVQIKQFPETPDPNHSLAHAGKSHREWWQLHLKQLCRHSTNSNSTAPLNTTPGPAPSCQGNGFAQNIMFNPYGNRSLFHSSLS